MFVNTVCAVVESVTVPTPTEPVTAARRIVSVVPAGIADVKRAVIFCGPAPFVVRTVYVVVASLSGLGVRPALTTEFTASVCPGEPETENDCAPLERAVRRSETTHAYAIRERIDVDRRTRMVNQVPPVIVNVTTRDEEVTTPAKAVASSV